MSTRSAGDSADQDNTPATCGCGCGQTPTPGNRYIRSHHLLKSPVEYIEEDRGFTTPCWIWQRSMSMEGYAIAKSENRSQPAQRVIYERERGPIPDGHVLARLCGVRACVNPDHGEPVTRGNPLFHQSSPLWQAAQADTCLKGHPLTPENTITLSSGKRVCRICKRAWQRAYYHRTEGAARRTAREERQRTKER